MKRLAYIIVLAFIFSSGLATENPGKNKGILSGKVIDKATGEALIGVKIQVKGTDTYCYTDMNGCFLLPANIQPTQEVSIDMVGYAPLTIKSHGLCMSPDVLLDPR